ncbi:MAG TPA: type I-E CRISPR-associated protein Cas6/Cse3/CasE [Polyangiaceae bacterium]
MYLSRLLLNVLSSDVRRDLNNVHAMHQRVLLGFPDRAIGSGARQTYEVLYRLDTSVRGDVSLLVQSEELPDWSRLPSEYLVSSFEPNPATTTLEPLLRRLTPGLGLRFRVRANPTKRLRAEPGVHGRRVELVGAERVLGWFLRKADTCGFAVAERDSQDDTSILAKYRIQVTEEPKVRGYRSSSPVIFGSVLLDGQLIVKDTMRFSAMLRGGLGSAKAYGFGLLSVAPA